MEQQNYQGIITVDVPLQVAFNSVLKRVSEWWTENLEGSSENVGDSFITTFGETFATFKITELIPEKKIVWLTTDCNLHFLKNKKEWKDTRIVWEFQPEDDKVKISMTHVGLSPGIECFEDCTQGWNHYIKTSLYQLLTEGEGQPDHEGYSAKYKQ